MPTLHTPVLGYTDASTESPNYNNLMEDFFYDYTAGLYNECLTLYMLKNNIYACQLLTKDWRPVAMYVKTMEWRIRDTVKEGDEESEKLAIAIFGLEAVFNFNRFGFNDMQLHALRAVAMQDRDLSPLPDDISRYMAAYFRLDSGGLLGEEEEVTNDNVHANPTP